MVNYYNRKSNVERIPEIDFASWEGKIATTGLVEKVKNNYEKLMEERYNVAQVAESLANETSQDLNNINRELAFHAAMWMNNYCDYHNFLFELEEYGDADYLSKHFYNSFLFFLKIYFLLNFVYS
jgi:hypothetical protein